MIRKNCIKPTAEVYTNHARTPTERFLQQTWWNPTKCCAFSPKWHEKSYDITSSAAYKHWVENEAHKHHQKQKKKDSLSTTTLFIHSAIMMSKRLVPLPHVVPSDEDKEAIFSPWIERFCGRRHRLYTVCIVYKPQDVSAQTQEEQIFRTKTWITHSIYKIPLQTSVIKQNLLSHSVITCSLYNPKLWSLCTQIIHGPRNLWGLPSVCLKNMAFW